MVSRDTSDPEQVAAEENLHERRMIVEQDILKRVLATFEGRHVLFNIIGKGDIYDMQGGMPYDHAESQRELGKRQVALEVLKDALTVAPDVYILMQKEAGDFEEQFKRDWEAQGKNDG